MGSGSLLRGRVIAAAFFVLALALPGVASAGPLDDPVKQWLPSSDGASWTWEWSDSAYAKTKTRERYTLAERAGQVFRLAWTTSDLENEDGAVRSDGIMDFRRSALGLVNLNWSSTPPPPQFPILCTDASGCGNSLAGSLYMVIWGSRSPVLAEPLLSGMRWSTLGGANNDVAGDSFYRGVETVVVPAFPAGVRAARIESEITQAGALGDPYGSGVRTVWWVYGVGPIKVDFRHTGGEIGEAVLQETNLKPLTAPPDGNWLPLNRGDKMTFRWKNSKHMRKASRQQFEVTQVVNAAAQVQVKSLSGPIAVSGTYLFSTRLGGIIGLAASTKSATRAKFPGLGPRSQPAAKRRRLVTPFDFMSYGFNPVLPDYPARGDTWKSTRGGRDYRVFGVTGSSKVLGIRRVRTPIGRFKALVVQSQLSQPGFRYGSGVRTSWFASGKGLVKLVFRHRDGSVSTIDRVG